MQSLAEVAAGTANEQTGNSFETGVQSEGAALALIIGASIFAIVWGAVNILLVSLLQLTTDQQSRYGQCRRLHEQE